MKTFIGFLALFLIASKAHAGTVLITEQEASFLQIHCLQLARHNAGTAHRIGPTGRNCIFAVHFQLKFRSFGGVAIDTQSLRVVYLKKPEVDITSRVARFAKATGVDIPDAEIPVGEHYIRVEVADLDGRTRKSVFALKVTP